MPDTPDLDAARLFDGLIDAVLAAGAIVLRHQAAGVAAETKRDGSLVSRADREAEAVILDTLAKLAPGVPVIAEEAVAAGEVPDFDGRAFLVDALDGTKEFLAGGDDFTVNVGLIDGGRPVFGIILAPVTGRVFATAAAGLSVQGRVGTGSGKVDPTLLASGIRPAMTPIHTSPIDPRGVRVVSSRSHRSAETDGFLKRFPIVSDVRMGSSIKFGLIAAGEADLYPRFGPTSQWDIAAGHAVLAAAGGEVTTTTGEAIRYLDRSRLGLAEPFLNPSFVAWGLPGIAGFPYGRDGSSAAGRNNRP